MPVNHLAPIVRDKQIPVRVHIHPHRVLRRPVAPEPTAITDADSPLIAIESMMPVVAKNLAHLVIARVRNMTSPARPPHIPDQNKLAAVAGPPLPSP